MKTIQHEFVELIPNDIQQGVLYISILYSTAVHKCVCGCGNEVVTPITPTDWSMTFNGVAITLYPSIGNWNFKCRSHYWIEKNKIIHARSWTEKEIQTGVKKDKKKKLSFFKKRKKK